MANTPEIPVDARRADSARVYLTVNLNATEAVSQMVNLAKRGDSAEISLRGNSDQVAEILASLSGHDIMASAKISLAGNKPVQEGSGVSAQVKISNAPRK